MKKSSALILVALLAVTVLLTVLAVQPVEARSGIRQATAAACTGSCGAWRYYGCCYTSGGYKLKQARDCTPDGIYYCTQTRCTTYLCAI